MLNLALDTAYKAGGAALSQEGEIIGEVMINVDTTHSKRLLSVVEGLLARAGCAKKNLTGITVSLGPGYFTGLRIGLATAQGLALGLSLKVAGVSSLRLLAENSAGFRGIIWAVTDARRGLVYAAPFESTSAGVRRLKDDMAMSPSRLLREISAPALLTGDGARLYRKMLLRPGVSLAPAWADLPRPGILAVLGDEAHKAGKALDPEFVEPHYVRPSDAEIRFGLPLDGYRLVE